MTMLPPRLVPPSYIPTVLYHHVSTGPYLIEKCGLLGPWTIMCSVNEESQFHYTSSILWSFRRQCCVPFRRHNFPNIIAMILVRPGLNHSMWVDHIMVVSAEQITPLAVFKSVLDFRPFVLLNKTKTIIPPSSRRLYRLPYIESNIFDGQGAKRGDMGLTMLPKPGEKSGWFASTRAN